MGIKHTFLVGVTKEKVLTAQRVASIINRDKFCTLGVRNGSQCIVICTKRRQEMGKNSRFVQEMISFAFLKRQLGVGTTPPF